MVDKLTVELDEAGLLQDKDSPLTLEKLYSLQYVDCIVKEVLRVAPPVGAGYRKALQTFEIDVSNTNTNMFISFYTLVQSATEINMGKR